MSEATAAKIRIWNLELEVLTKVFARLKLQKNKLSLRAWTEKSIIQRHYIPKNFLLNT